MPNIIEHQVTRVLAIMLLVWGLLISLAPLAAAAQSNESAGPYAPHCNKAFQNLPIDMAGEPIEKVSNGVLRVEGGPRVMSRFYMRHKKQYIDYDNSCFRPWGNLKRRTRLFLENNAGVLVAQDPLGSMPVPD